MFPEHGVPTSAKIFMYPTKLLRTLAFCLTRAHLSPHTHVVAQIPSETLGGISGVDSHANLCSNTRAGCRGVSILDWAASAPWRDLRSTKGELCWMLSVRREAGGFVGHCPHCARSGPLSEDVIRAVERQLRLVPLAGHWTLSWRPDAQTLRQSMQRQPTADSKRAPTIAIAGT